MVTNLCLAGTGVVFDGALLEVLCGVLLTSSFLGCVREGLVFFCQVAHIWQGGHPLRAVIMRG